VDKMIIGLLRVLCPYLRAMAKKSGNTVDDTIVNIVCMIAGSDTEKTDEKEG